jgi:hypothetical protein
MADDGANQPNVDFLAQMMFFWADKWQAHILRHGDALNDDQMELAKCVGVAEPERVRILKVPNVPLPHYEILFKTFVTTDIFSPNAHGLTLGYGIFMRDDSFPPKFWLTHEFVHVVQFERLGGLMSYLKQYLRECLTVGYDANHFEIEANQTAIRCLAKKGITYEFFDKIDPDWKK